MIKNKTTNWKKTIIVIVFIYLALNFVVSLLFRLDIIHNLDSPVIKEFSDTIKTKTKAILIEQDDNIKYDLVLFGTKRTITKNGDVSGRVKYSINGITNDILYVKWRIIKEEIKIISIYREKNDEYLYGSENS